MAEEGRDELYISVNISTKDFQYMDVYQTITSLVERYGIIPSTLKLEITETAIMMGNAGELETISSFRNYGFEVEIDDFGSGYSSLNTLKDIDVDVLKIDMGFLRTTRSERVERSMSILNMIISLSKILGFVRSDRRCGDKRSGQPSLANGMWSVSKGIIFPSRSQSMNLRSGICKSIHTNRSKRTSIERVPRTWS